MPTGIPNDETDAERAERLARRALVFSAVVLGASYRSAGEMIGVSPERARQICYRVWEDLQGSPGSAAFGEGGQPVAHWEMEAMRVRWSSDLLAQILARYRAGETLTAMAREYGIGRARMQQVKSRAELLERRGKGGEKKAGSST